MQLELELGLEGLQVPGSYPAQSGVFAAIAIAIPAVASASVNTQVGAGASAGIDPWDYSSNPKNVGTFLAQQSRLLHNEEISLAELISRVSTLVGELQHRLASYCASLEEYRWKLAASNQAYRPSPGYLTCLEDGPNPLNPAVYREEILPDMLRLASYADRWQEQLSGTPPPDPVATDTTVSPVQVVDLASYRRAHLVTTTTSN